MNSYVFLLYKNILYLFYPLIMQFIHMTSNHLSLRKIQQESKTLKLKKVFCKYLGPCLDFMNRDLLMEELLKITNTLPPSLI